MSLSSIRPTVFHKFLRVVRGGLSSGLLLFAMASATAETGRAQIIDDWNPYPMPSIPRPGYLEQIVDPVFGTKVTRITDAGNAVANPTNEPSLNGRTWEFQTGHAYSSRAAWNADQSLMLMEKGTQGMFFLDGDTYAPLFRRSWPGDVRWHPIDPDVLLYVDEGDHCLGAYEPRTDRKRWERCFAGYDSFEWGDPGKGKPSLDGNIMPVRARRSSDQHWIAFLYYIDSDSVSGEIDMTPYVEPGDAPDFVMSPLGDTIIIVGCLVGHTGSCEAQMGLDVATKQELWRTNNYHDPGHADEAVDANGEAWRIGTSKEGPFKGRIIKRNFRTGEAVSLIPYWGSHTSTRSIAAARSIAIVTFDEPSGSPLANEIVGVCVDGSCLQRYAHTHRAESSDYLAENHGSVSQFGDKIVFRSNWDSATGPIDAYVIELAVPERRAILRPPDQMHWTFTGQTSVTINWRGTAKQNHIEYGTAPGEYTEKEIALLSEPRPISSRGAFWEAKLTALREGTTYYYSVAGGPEHAFRTPPAPGRTDFALYAQADVGDAVTYPRMGAVQQLVAEGNPDFVIIAGDLTYGDIHQQSAVDQHFNDVMVWSRDAAYLPAWGNHEWEQPAHDDLRNYKGRFDLPNPKTSRDAPAAGCCGEDWYWFDYGNVRFISYPEPWTSRKTWSDWQRQSAVLMNEAEEDPVIDFVVTFGHRPAYSSGHEPGAAQLRDILDSFGARYRKFVLNIAGHSHNYERTLPRNGVTHITVGTGGSGVGGDDENCRWSVCPPPWWSAFRAAHNGALRLDVMTSPEGTPIIAGGFVCGPPSSRDDVDCGTGDILDEFEISVRIQMD